MYLHSLFVLVVERRPMHNLWWVDNTVTYCDVVHQTSCWWRHITCKCALDTKLQFYIRCSKTKRLVIDVGNQLEFLYGLKIISLILAKAIPDCYKKIVTI